MGRGGPTEGRLRVGCDPAATPPQPRTAPGPGPQRVRVRAPRGLMAPLDRRNTIGIGEEQ